MLVLEYSISNATSDTATWNRLQQEKASFAGGCLELYDTSSAHLRGPRLCGAIGADRETTVALRTGGHRLIIRAVAPTGQHAPSFTARYTIFRIGTSRRVGRCFAVRGDSAPDYWTPAAGGVMHCIQFVRRDNSCSARC